VLLHQFGEHLVLALGFPFQLLGPLLLPTLLAGVSPLERCRPILKELFLLSLPVLGCTTFRG